MDNIQVTNIEKGVIVNPSKKIKISQFTTLVNQWNAIVESAKENDVKVDLKSIDAQPDWNAKPEWEIVTNSFENVDVEKHARPIRVAEESYKNIEIRGFDANKYDFVQLTENDDTIPTFNYEENKTMEDYGYTEDFSKAVEDVINNTNFEEPKFEVPKFEEYEQNSKIEMTIPSKEEKEDDLDFEEMIKKALDESFKEESREIEKEEKPELNVEKESFSINNLDLSENGLMDIVKAKENALREKIAQNRQLEAGTMRIEKSITALKESKANYENKIQEYISKIESESEAENQREIDLESRKRESIEAMLAADREEKEAQDCYEYIQKSRVA